MRRGRWGALTATIAGLVALPALAVMGSSEAAESPTGPIIDSYPDVVTVVHTPAPDPTARAAAGLRIFPVPTSAADLGRITTAPNGDMWFVEGARNKVGRITTSGAIEEFNLPATTTGDGTVKDLDIDSAGNVWVAWDTGWHVTRFHPANPGAAYSWSFSYPYAEEIRVGPSATWVTMSFDEDGIVRIVGDNATWDSNAPECDGALGRGRDGLMWCQQFDRLIRVGAAGNAGIAYPLPAGATYPYSVATGPDNLIWFGRDSGGTMFTSPSRGNVGWITSGNQVRTINTGDRTAPRSLTTGRDGNVWFTSVGAAKGIGHVGRDGTGAVASVGNYSPTSVTYGRDGNIWFTDRRNNSIGRVSRDALWTTNVNVGADSQLRPHAQPRAKVRSKKLNANKARKKAPLKLACGSGLVSCSGRVVVKKGSAKVGTATYALARGAKKKVTVRLTKAARKALKRKKRFKVVVSLIPVSGAKVTRKVILTR